MKLSTSLIVLLSVGGAAATQDLLLRGSETLKSNSHPSRQLKNPDAKGKGEGKPDVVDWRCKDAPDFDTCPDFAAGRYGGDTCQQCCECECDGVDLESSKEKCTIEQEEDDGITVSCADEGLLQYNATIGSCEDNCAEACSTVEDSA